MATWVLAGAGPSVTSARAQPWLVLSLQVPGQTRAPRAFSSQLTMWSLKWFLCLSTGVTYVFALIFTSLREKAKELQGKVLCRGRFLIWRNLPEHAQNWLEITLFWIVLTVLMYLTVKLAGESGYSNVQNSPAHQGTSFCSPRRKMEKASPNKDYMFQTLILLTMDLVKFVSSMQNLKLTTANGSYLNPSNADVSVDAQNNITVYELWGNKESNCVDLCIKVGEEL
ncbi:protein FAM209-like [Budorcas taxicolor]|uniref:protein FAM209-like n=1 Tax=Budorcas taxicolor TaxID=37181 RepID=UPI0022837BA5|nr:protein FAM209-like [Budorcas taxicolor]